MRQWSTSFQAAVQTWSQSSYFWRELIPGVTAPTSRTNRSSPLYPVRFSESTSSSLSNQSSRGGCWGIDRRPSPSNTSVAHHRYTPEVGDLVIGRIGEVGSSRWKVEANARQDAVLMLSSVNLPGGVQRRKIESDALKMREFLAEGDVSLDIRPS